MEDTFLFKPGEYNFVVNQADVAVTIQMGAEIFGRDRFPFHQHHYALAQFRFRGSFQTPALHVTVGGVYIGRGTPWNGESVDA